MCIVLRCRKKWLKIVHSAQILFCAFTRLSRGPQNGYMCNGKCGLQIRYFNPSAGNENAGNMPDNPYKQQKINNITSPKVTSESSSRARSGPLPRPPRETPEKRRPGRGKSRARRLWNRQKRPRPRLTFLCAYAMIWTYKCREGAFFPVRRSFSAPRIRPDGGRAGRRSPNIMFF